MRHDPDDALEWLETDGLGGFAMGTASGVRTRRYHALLVAATEPPIGRRVLVEDLEVVALTMAGRFPLTSRRYPAPEGELLHPGGLPRAFQPEPWPRWEIALPDGTVLVHELVVRHGSPVVALRWLRVAGHGPLALEVRPFLGGRGFHALPEAPEPRFPIHVEANELGWELPGDTPDVHLRPFAPAWRWADDPIVHRRALLTDERARGLDHLQDLASPGVLTLDAGDGEEVGLTLAADRRETPETLPAFFPLSESERERRLQLAPRATGGATARLYRAADAYLVRRGAGRTVIAGYPWFGDWGRDTFIALRGLALATGRLDVAAEVVRTWAGHVEGGMLPNRFPDDGEDQGEAEYNSVDAALWYAVVAGETLDALAGAGARDPELEGAVARAVGAILAGHRDGTRHGIQVEADGLLRAGAPGLQLTWMDAKIGEHVVTPRRGKPVEIQALWVHALAVGERFDGSWAAYRERAESALAERYPLDEGGLADVVDADGVAGLVDRRIRPNQLFALGGIGRVLVPEDVAARALALVEAQLLTPLGPRSLARREGGYQPRYEGGVGHRDGAYHQGTVWPWLLGPFVDAWLAVHGDTPSRRAEARERFLPPLHAHLDAAGLGHVSEIADAEEPHVPKGAPFQAWSVAEVLRLTTKLA